MHERLDCLHDLGGHSSIGGLKVVSLDVPVLVAPDDQLETAWGSLRGLARCNL